MSEENINLTENDIRVLMCSFDKDTGLGLSKVMSLSIDELKERIDKLSEEKEWELISLSKIRNAVVKLMKMGYLDFGVKRGLKNTYHVTAIGIEYIVSIKKNVINIKKKGD